MRFTGKHGIVHEATITDRNLKRIVKQVPGPARARCCSNMSTATASRRPITSADVNDYIRDATGGDFTAKHFRTWGASVIAFEQLLAKAEEKRASASRR